MILYSLLYTLLVTFFPIVLFYTCIYTGKQNVIIIAGIKSYIIDTLISAKLVGDEYFNTENIIIIPVVLEGEQLESSINQQTSKKGFGPTPTTSLTTTTANNKSNSDSNNTSGLMTAPFIAKPAQINVWLRDLQEEVNTAINQGIVKIFMYCICVHSIVYT